MSIRCQITNGMEPMDLNRLDIIILSSLDAAKRNGVNAGWVDLLWLESQCTANAHLINASVNRLAQGRLLDKCSGLYRVTIFGQRALSVAAAGSQPHMLSIVK